MVKSIINLNIFLKNSDGDEEVSENDNDYLTYKDMLNSFVYISNT